VENIDKSKCKTFELSIDKQGCLLFYKGRVFRAINKEYVDEVVNMFSSGFIDELNKKKLIPKTWISEVKIEGYDLVVEHEYIKHWNYPYEWSFDMLKDAAMVVLEVNNIANKYNYEVMDGHAYNVVFNMNRPQYVDFGSFVKRRNNNWVSYNIFYNHFYIPLYLWSKGYSDIARNIFLMRDYFNEKEFFKIKYPLGGQTIYKILNMLRKVSIASKDDIYKKISNKYKKRIAIAINNIFKNKFNTYVLYNKIRKLKKPIEKSAWYDYHNKINPATNERFLRIKEIINNFKDASSVIELASNQGKFSEFIYENTHIKKIIATDYDKEAVNIMYLNNKDRDNFLPLVYDVVRTNGRKYDEYIHNRIKSDIVIALALTHHLILTQKVPIEYIFRTMSRLTNKYIIIEFMPLGLYAGDINNIPEVPSYYTLEWFKNEFKKHFILILDEKLELNRHVFVGKLKEA